MAASGIPNVEEVLQTLDQRIAELEAAEGDRAPELKDLRAEHDRFLAKWGKQNPTVVQLAGQIEELQEALDAAKPGSRKLQKLEGCLKKARLEAEAAVAHLAEADRQYDSASKARDLARERKRLADRELEQATANLGASDLAPPGGAAYSVVLQSAAQAVARSFGDPNSQEAVGAAAAFRTCAELIQRQEARVEAERQVALAAEQAAFDAGMDHDLEEADGAEAMVAQLQAQLAAADQAAAAVKAQHDKLEADWRVEAAAFKAGAEQHHADLQRRLYDTGMDKAKVDAALRESKEASEDRAADRDKKRKTSTAVAAASDQ